jgi:hypothetical protein
VFLRLSAPDARPPGAGFKNRAIALDKMGELFG